MEGEIMRSRTITFAAIPVVLLTLILVACTAPATNSGESKKGWLGVYIQDIDSDLMDALDLNSKDGVLVDDVVSDSPAEKGGIKPGDIIVKFNDVDTNSERKLRYKIKATNPGDKVEVVVLRDGKEKKLNVEMGEPKRSAYSYSYEYDDDDWKDHKGISVIMRDKRAGLGVVIDDLNEQLGEFFGIEDGEGVLIEKIVEDSPAEKAGLKAGDVIIEMDGKHVSNTSELRKILAEKEAGDEVKIIVMRDKRKKEIKAELSEKFGPSGFKWSSIAPDFHDIYIPAVPDWDEKEWQLYQKELKSSMKELKKELKELKKDLKREFKDIDID
ncbi:MAG: PDZ domain-containing protein [candidate division Zixibacteria bacterium]|nr:PDZ domain-containing protein [candidate division Zixibacteria bacterium]